MFSIRLSADRRKAMLLPLSVLTLFLTLLPSRPAAAHNGDLHQLRLVSIRCWETEDSIFDEPYLKVDGVKVWHADVMGRDWEISLRNVPTKVFVDNTVIKLYDEDGGFWDPDDRLGTVTITANEAGLGNRTVWFTADDDAIYSLVYRVL